MTALYVCEKPSQAKDIARVLGADQRQDGYFEGDQVLVTWCFGHLLEMAAPEDYDPELKTWRLETLPIIPEQWIWKVRKQAQKQYRIIVKLFKKADALVVATDADREGEAIAREVMQQGGWQGPVSRLWLSALDDKSIRKALAHPLPGAQTEALYHAAVARSQADWLVGMTLTRLYTLMAQQSGHAGVMSVGRVQTPTLKLVVDRDRLIEDFKTLPYFAVSARFQKPGAAAYFTGHWQVPDADSDQEGRCLSQSAAQAVANRCQGQTAYLSTVTTQRLQEAPPLLFALSTLQQEASKRFGMGAQAVLDSAQALYETHKLSTYPRTDCEYVPMSQFEEAAAIVQALQNDPDYAAIAGSADLSLKSRVWNDAKITAHHAIIPTGGRIHSHLNAPEKKLYDLIVRRYLAQFYPAHVADLTRLEIQVGGDRFTATAKIAGVSGWKPLLQTPKAGAETDTTCATQALPELHEGDTLNVIESQVEPKQTQPPARYTEGTLIQAMKTIGKTVDHPALKQRLKETSGIGTEATRASMIEVLLKRGFMVKKQKSLISTDAARVLIDALPEPVKDPATTAVWEQALEAIAEGKGNARQFVEDQATMITRLTTQIKQQLPGPFNALAHAAETYACPECNHPLVRRTGTSGFFWGCRNYPECKATLPDAKGKPGQPRSKAESTGQRCPECEQGVLLTRTVRKGKKQGKTFLGCNRYPECMHTEG